MKKNTTIILFSTLEHLSVSGVKLECIMNSYLHRLVYRFQWYDNIGRLNTRLFYRDRKINLKEYLQLRLKEDAERPLDIVSSVVR